MWISAWRAFLLLNGGWIQFGLSQPCVPNGSVRKVCRSGLSSIFAEVAKWIALAFGLGSVCLYLGIGSAAWTRPSIRKVFLFLLAMMAGCCGLFALSALSYGTIKFIATAFLLLGAISISVVVCRLALPMLKDAAEEVRIGAKRVPAELLSQYVLASVAIGTYAVWRLALYEPATPQVVALPREQDRSSPYMRVFGVSQPPYGYWSFASECPRNAPWAQRKSVASQLRPNA